MASSIGAPLHDPGVTNAAPVVALIIVDDRDATDFQTWVATVAANSVIHGLRYCVSVASHESDRIEAGFFRMARPSDWMVVPIDAFSDYPAALAEVARLYPGNDIIQIAAGASLPFAWDARLQKGNYASRNIAAATAMCDVAPMFALIDEALRHDADATLVDRTAYTMGDRSYYDIPRVHPVATYLRRCALDLLLPELAIAAASPQATLDDLTRRLRAKGWNCVICDYLYVGVPLPVVTGVATGDEVETSAYLQNHPLLALRRSVNSALRAGMASVAVPGLDSRPVLLHVTHFWGGGVEKWVRDFARADESRTHLVLSSFRIGETGGQRLVLYSNPADSSPIRVWDIAQPIRSTVSSSIEYRRILEQIIREFEVESVIVSSLIGHSLDALDQPIKTLVVCHDYYPICQAINPQFGTTCVQCTVDDLRRCAKLNPLNNIFTDQASEEWHEMRSLYVQLLLDNRIDLVAPSPSVFTNLKRLAPRLEAITTHLIPHGIDFPAAALPAATRNATEPLRIVVLGRIKQHKGSELLRAASVELNQYAEITLVGCGEDGVKLAKACNWHFIEKYQTEELPAILSKIAPHAGLLASVVPETFSYTLSELNQLAIPAVATALGSFTDRIVHGKSGFLFYPTKEALVEIIRLLHAQPELLAAVADRLSSQKTPRNLEAMVNDYRALIPAVARRAARFRVGIGMQTGLTDPYRQLTEAYVQVSQAYDATKTAYEQTKVECALAEAAFVQSNAAYTQARTDYDHTHAEFAQLRALFDEWIVSYNALESAKHWWRIPSAIRRLAKLHEKIRTFNERAREAEELPSAQVTAQKP